MNITLTGNKIAQDTKFLAFEKNNGVDVINIAVDTDEEWTYKLDVKYPDKCCSCEQLYNIIDLTRTGNVCTAVLTKDMLPFTGKYIMQLRGISGDKVYHSDTFDCWVKYSIEPASTYDPVPSEFYQIEDNITEINNNPPKPGENGYWLIWDIATSQYKESNIPLPDGTLPNITVDTSGKYLSNDGKKAYWAEVQVGEENKIDKIEVNGVEQPIIDKTVNIAVPTKTSDLSNDSGYITNEALDGYATKAELPTKVSQLENDSKFINESALDGYAKTADIPTKTSQLNNDSGYITANDVPVKSVDGATGDVVTNAVKTTVQTLTDTQKQQARTNIGAGTSSFDGDYNSLINKPTIPTKTSELTNDSGYITDAALTGYAKTTDIPTKTSQLDNDSHYITASEAPVQSVNTKTGAVVLGASDVGAISTGNISQTLGTSTTKVPSEKAVSDALSSVGTGDMLKSTYDPTGSVATAGGIPGYVEANGGKIDTIKVNGTAQVISDKTVNITVPTKTSDITNDSGYLTSAPVTSVNSKTGAVVLTASDVGALPADTVIPTVNNATLTIRRNSVDIGSFTANSADDVNIDINVPTDKSDIGLGNVDNVKQYSASNPPPYPVTSVNGETGAVTVREVPDVTTADNGKFLRVVSGAWAAAEGDTSFDITGASTGQSPIINAVDTDGKPTAWGTALLAKADGSNIPIDAQDTWRIRIAALPGMKVYGKADANGKIMAYIDAACTQEANNAVVLGLVEYGNALLIYDHKTYQCVGFEEPASMQGSGYYLIAVFFRSEIDTDSAGTAVLKVETAKLNIQDYMIGVIDAPITITAGELPLTTITTT